MNLYYDYARLGACIQTNGNELISNAKYLSPSSEDYNELITKMYQYPGTRGPYKDGNEKGKVKEVGIVEKKVKKGCCGK